MISTKIAEFCYRRDSFAFFASFLFDTFEVLQEFLTLKQHITNI
jgi:hypothetical protein